MAQPSELLPPRRVLIVDDDELTRESLSAHLRAADFEVAVALDGEEALTIIGRRWFPVIVTDRAMPIMDGIQFVSRLRCTSIAPTYVIMLTAINDAHDYELGYCAGVDLYIVKGSQDRELVARVAAAFAAVRRRQAQSAYQDDGPITVDLESGAHSARHLVGRLHAEMSRAARGAQSLQVVSVCIETQAQTQLNKATSDALFGAVQTAVRAKLDWIARLPSPRQASRLAVVMPDSGPQAFAAFEQGVRNAFVSANSAVLRDSQLTFGVALLTEAGERPTALGLLAEAERKRRGAMGRQVPMAPVNNLQDGEAA